MTPPNPKNHTPASPPEDRPDADPFDVETPQVPAAGPADAEATSPPAGQSGLVSLVGAGPGDPGLITVAGLDRLRRADAVVYDALANPCLLDHAPPGARRIDAGKRAGHHRLTQDQTNALLGDLADQGLRVVRLKGGDPYLFGRGAEEVIFLAGRGVRVEVIPGVTAGIAAPMAGGIPVTHRELASTVTFVTGHQAPDRSTPRVDYAALAAMIRAGGTVCFYMGVGRLAAIADQLVGRGLPADTPAAVVQSGTLPLQRTARAPLSDIAKRAQRSGLAPPAIVVVGPVAGLASPGLDYFTDPRTRPLLGRRILITRTRRQSSRLRLKLQALGAHVIEAPTIEVLPPESWDPLDQAIHRLARGDWVVLTSVHGVEALAERLAALSLDTRRLGGVRLAVVGEATARALRDRLAIEADLVPPRALGRALGEQMIADHDMAGARCLLVTTDAAPPDLPRQLEEAGAQVHVLTAYRTRIALSLPEAARGAIQRGEVDWAVFTSSSTASNLLTLLGGSASALGGAAVASIGPSTSATCRALGLAVDAQPRQPSLDALVEAIVGADRQRAGHP